MKDFGIGDEVREVVACPNWNCAGLEHFRPVICLFFGVTWLQERIVGFPQTLLSEAVHLVVFPGGS